MVALLPPRNTRVLVGPEVGGVAREWGAEIFVDFVVEKVLGKTPNKSTIKLYNLSPASLQWLEQPEQAVQLLAGSYVPGTLFYGEINSKEGVRTERVGPDYVTTIKAQDGKRVIQAGYFTGSYPPGTVRSKILTDALAANVLPRGYIHPLPERVYEAGASFSAPLASVLDTLYAGELATWSIQGGVFQLVALGAQLPGTAPVISDRTGMIGIPKRTKKGVNVSMWLAGDVQPGGGFSVQSKTWTGAAKTTKLTHRGDSDGGKWQTDLVGVPIAA